MNHENRLIEYGLEAPLFTVNLKGKLKHNNMEEFDYRLLVSAPQANGMMRVARSDEPWVIEIPQKTFRGLFVSLAELRSRLLVSIDRFAVKRIEIEKPKSPPIVLEQDLQRADESKKWKMLAPIPGYAKTFMVESLLLAFSQLNGMARVKAIEDSQDLRALKEYGLDEPTRIRFFREGKAQMVELLLGAGPGDTAFGMVKKGNTIASIPISRLSVIPDDAAGLLQK